MTLQLDPLFFDPNRWEGLLADVARRHHVPGIVAGVLHLDPDTDAERRFVSATGIANLRTGAETDRTTLCQIGSITKVVTSTMIMQLREEGKLDLGTKVSDILPDLRLADADTAEISVAHLLTHTSGIDGDLFTDTGRGDDCVEKYLETLSSAVSLFRPGRGWSYCNSGFVIAGRIVEVLDGTTWDNALRTRICQRLGLEHFLTLAEDIMAYRHQYGHVRNPGSREWTPAPVAQLTRSMGPAGLITSSADDLLNFGAAFLRKGETSTGRRLLNEDSVSLMIKAHHTLDPAASGIAPQWGHGWMIDSWESHRVHWHSGTTIGNNAWFHVLPDDGLVFVVFCNGGVAPKAAPEIYGAFAQCFAGIDVAPASRPKPGVSIEKIDQELLGEYTDASTIVEIFTNRDGVPQVRMSSKMDDDDEIADPVTSELFPGGRDNLWFTREDDLSPWSRISFATVDGRDVVYAGIRCLPRTITTAEGKQ